MNRPVKFRVWDSFKKRLIPDDEYCIYRGSPVQTYVHVGDGYYQIELATTDNGTGHFVEDNWIIQQYTGLKDVTGKDIYEGDILKCKQTTDWLEPFNNISYYKHVVKFQILPSGESDISGFIRIPIDREIIGNIYENPELL